MKSKMWIIAIAFFSLAELSVAQTKAIDEKKFFKDELPIVMKLSTDIKGLIAEKKNLNYVNAVISFKFPDSSIMEGPVQIKPRGKFRKEHCRLSSLAVNFKNQASPAFSKLGTLKMVGGCGFTASHEQFLLKEYLIYKIYNMFTDMSFRVRLLHVNYYDTKAKIKSYTQYAFLMEDVDDLGKRNKCVEKELVRYSPKGMRREEATLFFLFQYMIGNTDWSIPFYHNVKLMVDRKDSLSMPYPIAYDFDMTGLVDPPYGGPPPELGIERLTQRVYRGYARSLDEIETAAKLFLEKEEAIYALINQFNLLTPGNKKDMLRFLKEFFTEIKSKKELKKIFVDNALDN